LSGSQFKPPALPGVSDIGGLVREHDTRIWRIIRGYVNRAYEKKSFKQVEKIGVDETSSRKGHNYVTGTSKNSV
jgi:transposase